MTAERAIIYGALTGFAAAIALCILFGVLDVQCRNDPAGRFWNAQEQRCQQSEVKL